MENTVVLMIQKISIYWYFSLQRRNLCHTDRWFSLLGPNESLMSLCRWMARWGILRRGRGTWTSRWTSLLSICRQRDPEDEGGRKLGGGKAQPKHNSLFQYLDHDAAGHGEVAVEPGVPDATAVALHAHLQAALLGPLGPRLHPQARAVRVCAHHRKTVARQVAPAHREGDDTGEVPGQEVLWREPWWGIWIKRKVESWTAIVKRWRRGQTFEDGRISHCSASLSSMKPAASRRRLHSSTTEKQKEKVRLVPKFRWLTKKTISSFLARGLLCNAWNHCFISLLGNTLCGAPKAELPREEICTTSFLSCHLLYCWRVHFSLFPSQQRWIENFVSHLKKVPCRQWPPLSSHHSDLWWLCKTVQLLIKCHHTTLLRYQRNIARFKVKLYKQMICWKRRLNKYCVWWISTNATHANPVCPVDIQAINVRHDYYRDTGKPLGWQTAETLWLRTARPLWNSSWSRTEGEDRKSNR